MSRDYPSRDSLPEFYFNGVHIRKLNGRGWDRVGYSDMIARDGSIINLTPYDQDDWVDPAEKTYGALKFNSETRHIVLVGGWYSRKARHGIFEFDEIFTDSQFLSLQTYVKEFLGIHPTVKVAGHNQVQPKTCPQFDVPKFLDLIVIPEENYYDG
jgi:N-acetylmuramoyl-L-alanine amidase